MMDPLGNNSPLFHGCSMNYWGVFLWAETWDVSDGTKAIFRYVKVVVVLNLDWNSQRTEQRELFCCWLSIEHWSVALAEGIFKKTFVNASSKSFPVSSNSLIWLGQPFFSDQGTPGPCLRGGGCTSQEVLNSFFSIKRFLHCSTLVSDCKWHCHKFVMSRVLTSLDRMWWYPSLKNGSDGINSSSVALLSLVISRGLWTPFMISVFYFSFMLSSETSVLPSHVLCSHWKLEAAYIKPQTRKELARSSDLSSSSKEESLPL